MIGRARRARARDRDRAARIALLDTAARESGDRDLTVLLLAVTGAHAAGDDTTTDALLAQHAPTPTPPLHPVEVWGVGITSISGGTA